MTLLLKSVKLSAETSDLEVVEAGETLFKGKIVPSPMPLGRPKPKENMTCKRKRFPFIFSVSSSCGS
jgi:hypothetical protein